MTTAEALPYTKIQMPEEGSPEWLEVRRTSGITASECAAVMGLSKWSNPHELYLLKRGLIESSEPSLQMEWGTAVEPIIRRQFEKQTGFTGYKPDFMAVSTEYPWLAANLDYIIVGEDGSEEEGAEFKMSDSTRDWGESYTQDCPLAYFIQVQHQLLVTRLKTIYLYPRLPYSDYRVYPITPDAAIQAKIAEVTKDFWFNNVQAGVEPPATDPDSVKKLYPSVNDEIVELPADALSLVEKHKAALETIEAAEVAEKEAKARLMQLLGPNKRGTIPDWDGSISRSFVKGSTYTVTRKDGVTSRINHPRNKG